MSKVDDLRALREARYAAAAAVRPPKAAPAPVRAGTAAAATVPATVPPAKTAKPARASKGPKLALVAELAGVGTGESAEPCGHRSMNGRSCTRDSGHAEKNHRYG